MIDLLQSPWPWYVGGILIGLTVPLLLLLGNKALGISSTLRQICAVCVPADIEFFKYDWKKQIWSLYFIGGILIGGFIGGYLLKNPDAIQLSSETISDLQALGVKDFSGILPSDLFRWSELFTLRGFILMVVGGFLVGFGTRYAGGCTSGHSIMGLSNLQWPSLVATICFMVGGLIMTHLILPYLLAL